MAKEDLKKEPMDDHKSRAAEINMEYEAMFKILFPEQEPHDGLNRQIHPALKVIFLVMARREMQLENRIKKLEEV